MCSYRVYRSNAYRYRVYRFRVYRKRVYRYIVYRCRIYMYSVYNNVLRSWVASSDRGTPPQPGREEWRGKF